MRTRYTASLAVGLMIATSSAAAPISMVRNAPKKAPSSESASSDSFFAKLKNATPKGISTPAPWKRTSSSPNQTTAKQQAVAPQAVIAVARATEARGDVEGARKLLHNHLSANRFDVKALRELGRLEDRHGNLTEAELRYRQAIGADAKSSAAVNDLALCLARQDKLELSAEAFRHAISMQPSKALYRNNLAAVLVRQGKANEAAEQMRVVYDPATAAFNVGQLLAKEGRSVEAATRYREALALKPSFNPAQVALAKVDPRAIAPPTTPIAPTAIAQTPVAPQAPAESLPLPPAVTPTATLPTLTAQPVAAVNSTPYVAAGPAFNAGPRYDAPQHVTPQQAAPAFPRLLPPVIER